MDNANEVVDIDRRVKARCMVCGEIFRGADRGLTEMQFSIHNEDRHRGKLEAGDVLTLTFFTGRPPSLVEKKVKVKVKRGEKKRWTDVSFDKNGIAEKAEWV